MKDAIRVSFDLDEVLFVSPKTHDTEPPLPFPFDRIYTERLRQGTPDLIHELQRMGCEVWVYTSSERSEKYIRGLFRHYHIKLDGVVNAERHRREVQRDRREMLPQKLPNWYRITLHIDDEAIICTAGKDYGFDVYQLSGPDREWKEKIIQYLQRILKTRN